MEILYGNKRMVFANGLASEKEGKRELIVKTLVQLIAYVKLWEDFL